MNLEEWKAFCDEAKKNPNSVPIVVSTPEGGRVFTFALKGYEQEAIDEISKDFSNGGRYEDYCEEAIFLEKIEVRG